MKYSVLPADAVIFTLVLLAWALAAAGPPAGGSTIESPGWLKPALPTLTSGVVGSCSSPVSGFTAPCAMAISSHGPGPKQLSTALAVRGTWRFFTIEKV